MKLAIFIFYIFVTGIIQAKPIAKNELKRYSDDPTVQLFRDYLQIDTSEQKNLYQAVDFWRGQAEILGAQFRVFEPAGLPICVITVEGANRTLPSIMLNSHMDVVPAVAEDWTYPPFDATMDENGDIYGRGAQDCKDVAIEYIEALKAVKRNNITLQRTLHMTLMPDEETGGFKGMKAFAYTADFKELNVGFVLDEGLTASDFTMYAAYTDKRPWQMSFTFHGMAGHALGIPDNTAMEKATRFLDKLMHMREEQKELMKNHNSTDFGSYSSLNANIMFGGTSVNTIPSEVTVVVDMRLATDADPVAVQDMVSWNQVYVTSWSRVLSANEL